MTPIWHPSPNFGPRKLGVIADMVVIHYTAMANAEGALKVLCNPDNEVSAHYLIASDGMVYQLVDEAHRAWHSGAGRWGDVVDVNSRSIGIELDNDGFSPFSSALMDSLEALVSGIMARWSIGPARVIGHSDLAPGRKIDPGLRFDWQRLELAGLALRREVGAAMPEAQFRELAALVGYTADVDDVAVLDAVRRRWRPWGAGALVEADIRALTGAAIAQGLDPYGPLA
jgi:N-acetylmuramoyl-L-alanine amidase